MTQAHPPYPGRPGTPRTHVNADSLDDVTRQSVERGHELDRTSGNGLTIFAVGFLASIAACGLFVWANIELNQNLLHHPADEPYSAISLPQAGGPGADAANWANPTKSLAQLRAMSHKHLHTYGVVNREKRIIRIPIDRAMRLLVKQNWPLGGKNPRTQNNHEDTKALSPEKKEEKGNGSG